MKKLLNNIYIFLKEGTKRVNATTGSVAKKLLLISIPIMLSSLVNNLYEFIDTLWLGRFSDSAIASIQICRTLVWFFVSLGIGLGAGGSILVSQSEGANNHKELNRYAGQTLILLVMISVVVFFIAMVFPEKILIIMRTPEDIIPDSALYIRIVLGAAPLLYLSFGFISIMNGMGNTIIPFVFTLITLVLNAVLDPLLIFGVGIFPRMGVGGAALATTISRVLVVIFALIYIYKGKTGLRLTKDIFRPSLKHIKNILKIGIPGSAGSWGTSFGFVIMMSIISQVANTYYNGDTTIINANGISNAIIGLFFLMTIGLGRATSIAVGQNIGAGNTNRVDRTIWTSVLIALGLLIIGTIIINIGGGELAYIFIPKDQPNSIETAIVLGDIIRILTPGLITFGLTFVMMGAFQGSGSAVPVMITHLSRLWLVRIPLAYYLAFRLGMAEKGVWWALNISNIVVSVGAFIYFLTGRWRKKAIVKKEKFVIKLSESN